MTQPKKKTTTSRKTGTNLSDNLRQRVLEDAKTLKVPLSAELLDAALSRADQEGLSHLNFLELILGEPAASTHDVWDWCHTHLGPTVQSVRGRIRQALRGEQKQPTLLLETG